MAEAVLVVARERVRGKSGLVCRVPCMVLWVEADGLCRGWCCEWCRGFVEALCGFGLVG